ncbi:sugar ABC transporter permease [Paenibacillus baekrokdamisoli]|uniref:Sugar ABC transporter permease n=1 Tax=Paenibacillus baekrokdamisoli TaxID=1712516 RepID=A0A3G9JDG3_9BACL|nr:carbohydrate ABC transporter permease [Paenibacillus baekrokdamisoli]MBB3072952.1 multiple sugar transport system permease protein [Paenibacillus baekrokdamisoli]BBH22028.1 sugar ABC transporter permease [Paenibacillus baekrokdamisoli]
MNQTKLVKASLYLLVLIFVVAFSFPLYWLFVNSIQPLFTGTAWFPLHPTLENYHLAFTLRPYWMFFKNSVILTTISVVLPLFFSFFSGFAFARLRAKFKGFLFMIILSTMMVPATVILIPQYVLFHEYGLLGTYLPWILGGIGGSPFVIFLYRQFFMNIPMELDEAARMDGCSTYGIIFRIYIPISLPVIATAGILLFNNSWGADFLTPFMFLQESQYPLSTALLQIGYIYPKSPNIEIPQVQFAALVIFILPILVVYLFGQRFLVSGIMTGAVKS